MGLLFGSRAGITTQSSSALAKIIGNGTAVDMAQLRAFFGISSTTDLIPHRPGTNVNARPIVTPDQAMRNSAVWACLRLRGDLLSTLPVNVYRQAHVDGALLDIPITTPPVLMYPGGEQCGRCEWLYSSQTDLDRVGNTVGIIREKNSNGLPSVIELQLTQSVSISTKNNKITSYKIGGETWLPENIWHEKQFTVSGLPVGLSPVAYAALTLGRWASIEEFVQSWFGSGAVPRARLKNEAKKLNAGESLVVKESWRAAIASGEPFVHGNDWTYELIQADQASGDWLAGMNASDVDVARFFGCPADLIEAEVKGSTITYANVTQRNLQFLIMNMRPAIRRREWALSQLTASPRYVKFDIEDFLAMDPASRAAYIKTLIDSRVISPDEGRAMIDREPMTQQQEDQLLTFFPPKGTVLAGAGEEAPASAGPAG